MRTIKRSERHTLALVLLITVFSLTTQVSAQTELTDTDKDQIVRAVLKTHLELHSPFRQNLLLSSVGLEALPTEEIANSFNLTLISASEIKAHYGGTGWLAYLTIGTIRPRELGAIVRVALVQHSGSCWGTPRQREVKSAVYEVNRPGHDWIASVQTTPVASVEPWPEPHDPHDYSVGHPLVELILPRKPSNFSHLNLLTSKDPY